MGNNSKMPLMASFSTDKTHTGIFNMDKATKSVWSQTPCDELEERGYSINMLKDSQPGFVDILLQYRDTQIESSGQSLEEALTEYDKMVHYALESIYVTAWENSKQTQVPISPGMVYRVMTANENARPTEKEISRINASIEKMCRIWIKITPREDVQRKNPNIKEIRGMMIAGHQMTGILNGTLTQFWMISALPCLYSVADQWNQIRRVPLSMISCKVKFTESIGHLKNILITHIERIKSKNFKNNGMLFETIYAEMFSNTPTPKQRERIAKNVKSILNDFVGNGYIKSFDFERGPRNSLRKLLINLVDVT